MNTVSAASIRKLPGEGPSNPLLISELPKAIRQLVQNASQNTSRDAEFELAQRKLARAGWFLEIYLYPGVSHVLSSIDGQLVRYINDQSPVDLSEDEIKKLFDESPVAVQSLDASIADLVTVASDFNRGLLARGQANSVLKEKGWGLIKVRHPHASHVLTPLVGNECKARLLAIRSAGSAS